MLGNKLLKILKSLSSTEMKELKRMFESSFFSKNESLLIFYKYVLKYHPNFDSPNLTKEKIYKKLYPNKPFKDGVMRVKISQFTRLVEDFLIWKETQNDNFRRKRILKEAFGKRNLFDLFEKNSQLLKADLDAHPFRDMEYFQDRIRLNYDFAFHPLRNRYAPEDNSLAELIDEIDRYALLAKLRIGIALKNDEKLFSKKYDLDFLELKKDAWIKEFQLENPLINLYLSLFELLENNQEKDFYELKKLFLGNAEIIRGNDRLIIYYLSLNFAIGKVNTGDIKFYKETLELYKVGLELRILLNQGKISEFAFGNIVSVACHEKDFDWTAQFIHKYKKYLDEIVQEDATTYSLAILDFHRQYFEEAIFHLLGKTFSKSYQPKVRMLTIRIYFEQFLCNTSYFELLISNIKAYEKFIQRDHFFSEKKLDHHLNTLKLLQKLAKKINSKEDTRKTKKWFLEELNSGKVYVSKKYLLQKAKDL